MWCEIGFFFSLWCCGNLKLAMMSLFDCWERSQSRSQSREISNAADPSLLIGSCPPSSSSQTMVSFVLTPELQETIREYNAVIRKRKASEEIDEKCDSIQHLQLAQVASTLQKEYPTKRDEYSLHNILKHTSLYLEPKPKPKPVYLKEDYGNDRLLNIKPEWPHCAKEWNSKSTIQWFGTSGLPKRFRCSQMKMFLPQIRKWSRIRYRLLSIFFCLWSLYSLRYSFG